MLILIFMIYLRSCLSLSGYPLTRIGLGAFKQYDNRNYIQGSKPALANIFFLRTNI
jgi:hypothetical protein